MAKKEYDKRDYHQELTDKLIASIESAQKLNWEKPWFSAPSTRPFNLETGTRYSGCNLMATALSGFEDPRWLTFRGISSYAQKKDIELQLRKGSKGTPIFKAFAKEITEDKNGLALDKPRKIIFMAYAGTVFNGEQIDGMPEYTKRANQPKGYRELPWCVVQDWGPYGWYAEAKHFQRRSTTFDFIASFATSA